MPNTPPLSSSSSALSIIHVNGRWVVRVAAPATQRGFQDYRCMNEQIAVEFAQMFNTSKPPPSRHGAATDQILASRGNPRRWWSTTAERR